MFEFVTAFTGGVMASLSPCVYPLIPITISYFGVEGRAKALTLFLCGKVTMLVVLGLIAVRMGVTFGAAAQFPSVQIGIGAMLLFLGIYSMVGKLPKFFKGVDLMGEKITRSNSGAFVLGLGTTLLVSPCTTPMLYSVLVIVSSSESFLYGALIMASYGLGFSLILSLFGYGFIKKMPRGGKWMSVVNRVSSAGLIVLGVYYIYQGVK